jgi:hypothetical protein
VPLPSSEADAHGELLRDGIFALRTRRFGAVAEMIVKRLRHYSRARSIFHDLWDESGGQRIEVKFSVVLKRAERRLTEATVLECIADATAERRMVAFAEWQRHAFDCNIQQVKRGEFDLLYYGLFFADCVQVFRLRSDEIREDSGGGKIRYSDFQHKGNAGEGQFHITPATLPAHLAHYHFQTLSYAELARLLGES